MNTASCGRVLVGFAESLAAIEAVWNLLDHGYEVLAFSRAQSRPALRKDPRVRVVTVPAPELDFAACVRQLRRLYENESVDVVMPLDDVSVALLDALASGDAGVTVAGPIGDLARLALDKRLQLAAAAKVGLDVPSTLVHEPGDDARASVDAWLSAQGSVHLGGTDWIVKPALAVTMKAGRVSKGRTAFVSDVDELVRTLAGRSDPVLVQPLVRGVGTGVFGFASAAERGPWSGHRRVRMMNPSGSGSSACRSVDPEPGLVEPLDRLLQDVGWRGLFMMEFLLDEDGRAWFMELNGRTWGSTVLATRRGLDYPAWAVALGLDSEFAPTSPQIGEHLTARHLGREILHLAFVARGRLRLRRARLRSAGPDPALASYPTMPGAVRDVLSWRSGECLYNSRRGRLGVLLTDTLQTIWSR